MESSKSFSFLMVNWFLSKFIVIVRQMLKYERLLVRILPLGLHNNINVTYVLIWEVGERAFLVNRRNCFLLRFKKTKDMNLIWEEFYIFGISVILLLNNYSL